MRFVLHLFMQNWKDYKVRIKIPVRWGDMDAYEHVNNAVYVKWNEDARIEYLKKLSKKLHDGKVGPILARQDVKYIFPVVFPDTINIGIRVCEILKDRLVFETKMWSKKSKRLVAIVHSTVMAYDLMKKEKTDIPNAWLLGIHKIQGE